jgi:hypothetical protein
MHFKNLFNIGIVLTLLASCGTTTTPTAPVTVTSLLALQPGESAAISCAAAPVCPPPPVCLPACGDLSCNGTETCSTCSGDCGLCAPVEPKVSPLAVVETSTILNNPERGFYKGVNLSTGATSAASHYTSGHSLDLALVELRPYINKAIDQAFLDSLNNGFKAVRASGMKVILRFRYSNSSTAPTDAPLSIILQHITQLTPLIVANADVIAVQQIGFIGAWGEWHTSSNNLNTPSAQTSNRSLQIRTPSQKDAVFPGGPLTARASTGKGRVGHHNDCFLASTSDMGTYASPVDTWKAYVAQEGKFTPVGGETCAVNPPRTDCPTALAELRAHSWTYLNEDYNKLVNDPWKTQGCYDTINKYLGYYFAVTRVLMSEKVRPGGILQVEFDVNNRGFAAPMNSRPVYLTFTLGTTKHVVQLPVDSRDWAPGVSTVKAKIRFPANLALGNYQVAVWLPDAAPSLKNDDRYSIKLANPSNLLNSALPVALTDGVTDPTATTFSVIP